MNIPNTQQVTEKVNEICNLILDNKNNVEYLCRDGSVVINPNTLDFTYIGKWGNNVLMTAIKTKINNDDAKRIYNLASHILIYSMNFGGFNVITITDKKNDKVSKKHTA